VSLKEHFISLDIFGEIYKNKGIGSKLEAWLVFFGQDQPEAVLDLITKYPQFREYYNHVYEICRNLENVMGFFSEELRMMDRNTTKLMIDELEETVKAQKTQLEEKEAALSEKEAALLEKDEIIAELRRQLADKKA
jgi:uncharacterized protein YfeS